MRAIRRFALRVADQFHPDRIILFGSFAYGKPTADSDVDILVVMPTRNPISQAVKIRMAMPAPFPMDLIVRAPEMSSRRIEMGDSFMTEIVNKGKVLHEKSNGAVGAKSRSRFSTRRKNHSGRRPVS